MTPPPYFTTGLRNVPYVGGDELAAHIDDRMKDLAEYVRDDYLEDVSAARPANGRFGQQFWCEDTTDLYVGKGTGWRFDHATAFCEATSSGGRGSSGIVPFDALATTGGPTDGSSLFTRVAASGGHRVQVSAGGLYEVIVSLTCSAGANADLRLVSSETATPLDQHVGIANPSLHATTRLGAGSLIHVMIDSISGSAAVTRLFVRRVGP